jgi:AcrR family transcriptional regulator
MTHPRATETRRRLLHAATEVFAARGYESATVREITDRAHANQAAINYHFGNKAALYAATIDAALEESLLPLDAVPPRRTTRDALLHALVHSLVAGALRGEPTCVHVRLLSAELLRPTGTLRMVIRDALVTHTRPLGVALAALRDGPDYLNPADDAPPADDADEVALLRAHCLLGACVAAMQLAPPEAYGTTAEATARQARLVGHLCRVLATGIAALRHVR